MKTLRVILIEPGQEPRDAVIVAETTLSVLQNAVDGYIELLRIDDVLDFYINEEGKLHHLEPNFALTHAAGQGRQVYDVVVGPVVVVRHSDDGDTLPVEDGDLLRVKEILRDYPRVVAGLLVMEA